MDRVRYAHVVVAILAVFAFGACDASDSVREYVSVSRQTLLSQLVRNDAAKIEPPDSTEPSHFGFAIAVDGDTLVVGAPYLGVNRPGRAYVFVRQGPTWQRSELPLQRDDTAADYFGFSVAIAGDTIVVGAPAGPEGRVYTFRRAAGEWIVAGTPLVGDSETEFGSSVALTADWLAVGAPSDDRHGEDAGVVHVYRRVQGSWQPSPVLPEKALTTTLARLGTAVALSGDTLLVGAPYAAGFEGRAYVFERDGTAWRPQELTPARAEPNANPARAEPNANFGFSVALQQNKGLIGANGTAGARGAAYPIVKETSWRVGQSFGPQITAGDDAFGAAVAADGPRTLVAAPGSQGSGAAYVFEDVTAVAGQEPLRGLKPETGEVFGKALAVSGDLALIGAHTNDGTFGLVYTFAAPRAAPCSSGRDCRDGYCAEGVCCNNACSGPCRSCRAVDQVDGREGVCGNVAKGRDPLLQCQEQPIATCGQTGVCNGAGACELRLSGLQCAPASCPTETREDPRDLCDGGGTCVVVRARPCQRGYRCANGACRTICETDADCDQPSGFRCIDGGCKVPLAGPCRSDTDCASGSCAEQDGICCDAPCEGECVACTNAKKGSGIDGVCGQVPAGTDPDEECDPGPTCAADGMCDGGGHCRSYAPPSTPCGQWVCENASVAIENVCDGSGRCVATSHGCDPGRCTNGSCNGRCEAHEDCADAAFCNNVNHCEFLRDNGSGCSAADQCKTHYCENDQCCNRECNQFKCREGTCLSECANADDCKEPFACNPNNRKCEAPRAMAREAQGCSAARLPVRFESCLALLTMFVLSMLAKQRARNIRLRRQSEM